MTASLDSRILDTGRRLYDRFQGQRPSVFQKDYWMGKAMAWSMADADFKASLFRFVDVFPSLAGASDVAEHAREYFTQVPGGVLGKAGLKALTGGIGSALAARFIETNIETVASQFIAGVDTDDAMPKLAALREDGVAFTVSLLGEAVLSEPEADQYLDRYLGLLDALGRASSRWASLGGEAALDWGAAPRVNISIKPSSLYSQISGRAFERSVDHARERLRPILRKAIALDAAVLLDMEHYDLKNLTLALYQRIMEEPEFRGYPSSGIAMQAYLRDTPGDAGALVEWARRRGQPVTVRLVKGAYWDSEVALARQRNWPEPVYLHKAQSDLAFETIAGKFLENHEHVRLACGSHNLRSLAFVIETARERGIPDDEVEFQVLYGMAEPVRRALVEDGRRVRMYTPLGDMIPGMAYLVRRLLENTSNESFLRQGFVDMIDMERLLARPTPPDDPPVRAATPSGFQNAPLTDWSVAANRRSFARSLENLRKSLPRKVPLVVGGHERNGGSTLDSTDPNHPDRVVATVQSGDADALDAAVAAGVAAYAGWRDTPPDRRAAILFDAAAIARKRRMDLAALEVFEAGKNWDEADADVAEAIDFLEYYGHEMLRLASPQDLSRVPGERSSLFYEPCGVVAVIAPWNFPIAIAMGMVSAAIVAGNTVVYKPSSETPLCGYTVWKIFDDAGLPPGVLNFLPGPGALIGDGLVTHPDVWMTAFTGSRDVGLRINRLAAESSERSSHVKRVIAEMGGKNAIIVDADADLDGAVRDAIRSAFGYQGQKCSACSRLIVLDAVYDSVVERLAAAAESIVMGPAEDPATFVGAMISADAAAKVRQYIEIGKSEARLVLERLSSGDGHLAPLAIFADVDPGARIAQEEIFGPVLSVIRAADFDDALRIANGTAYALTGGVFSRSPAHIAAASDRFRVGNLYINRGSTGAIVGRHPFGGFRMSGVGSKAGGPDYLPQFMVPRNVVENTIRRSFTPDIESVEDGE